MKAQDDKNQSQASAVWMVGLMLIVSFAQYLYAQSADAFVPKKLASGVKDTGSAAKVVEVQAVDEKPSRFAGEDISNYTASRAAVFSMRNRSSDPFGLNQDPNAKPPVTKLANTNPIIRQTARPPTALKEIVKLIRVTTIMPGEKKFLVGVRALSESDEFPLVFQGKRINMKVVKVTSRSILFLNIDNGETASLETGMLPSGMMLGGDTIQPPGVLSKLANPPIEVGNGNETPSNN